MSTLTTVGYGDVTPQNDAEKIVSMVAMVIGVTVFAYFMGSTASLISAGNATEGAVAQRMAQMRDFLNVRRVPPSLKNKINSFYGAAARHQVLEDHDVIQHLSAPLQTELMLFLYRNTLERVPFFQGQDPHFITAVVNRLQLEYFAEGDVVVAEGDFGKSMYFVVTGQLEGRHYKMQKHEWIAAIKRKSLGTEKEKAARPRLSMVGKMRSSIHKLRTGSEDALPDDARDSSQWQYYPNAQLLGDDYTVVSQLEQGQHFGEYGCLFGQPRSSTIVALEFSELYSLRKDSLMEVYAQWPELEREFLQMVRQFEQLLGIEPSEPGPDPSAAARAEQSLASGARQSVDASLAGSYKPDQGKAQSEGGASAEISSRVQGHEEGGRDGSRRDRPETKIGMQKAARLVMSMKQFDQSSSSNPVIQLLNNGNDLKALMVARQASALHPGKMQEVRADPDRTQSEPVQPLLPGAVGVESGDSPGPSL